MAKLCAPKTRYAQYVWTDVKVNTTFYHLTEGEGGERECSKGLTIPDLEEGGLGACLCSLALSLFYAHCPSMLIRRAGLT